MKQDFLIYGRKPLLEALKAGRGLDKILLLKNAAGEEIAALRKLAAAAEVPVQSVPIEKLENVLGKYSRKPDLNHQGVIAFASIIPYYSMDDVLHHVYGMGETPLLVMLDGVTDVGNFGAIARSVECLGAHALIVPSHGSAQINAEAMKASAGALNNVMVCKEKSLITALKFLRVNGIRCFATALEDSSELQTADFTVPCCIILGAEGSGISREVLKLCDERLRIPMKGETESLNVSVSAGILLYEAMKQRTK